MGKVVALVPARSGSVRVKNKNIRQIGGTPLIGIAVKQAMAVDIIDEVFISTDSELYAQIAENYGACVPFLRPEEISGSDATDYQVFEHFLEWYVKKYNSEPELIVQIRATAPARDTETIRKAIEFMLSHEEFDSLRSVSSPHQNPYKMWVMDENNQVTPVVGGENGEYDMPTQRLQKCYGQDGVIDIVRPRTLRNYKNMAGKTIAGWSEHPKTWDIDDDDDLVMASKLLRSYKLNLMPSKARALGGYLGIIQGRLTESDQLQAFPKEDYQAEFEKARQCGYSSIECIRDRHYNRQNPLWTGAKALEECATLAYMQGVGIKSICDDYVLECDFSQLSVEQYNRLIDLLNYASVLHSEIVVYPLFEKADISILENRKVFVPVIKRLGRIAAKLGIRIALEISQSADFIYELMQEIDEENVGLCVDSGNLIAAGIDACDILTDARLRQYIFHVHIKDRDESNANVVIGTGREDFGKLIKALYHIEYEGILVTETDRGKNPLETAIYTKEYLANIIEAYSGER